MTDEREKPTDPTAPATPSVVDGDVAPGSEPSPVAKKQRPVADPWAHRRGEPRVFAFAWTVYLLCSVLGAILWHGGAPPMQEYGPPARLIVLLICLGIVLLWPVVRLSQESPDGPPVRAALVDLIVVVVPAQLVLWPLALLAGWPVATIGALSGIVSAWSVLTGGILALSFVGRRRGGGGGGGGRGGGGGGGGLRPWVWMTLCVVLLVAGPVAMLAGRGLGGEPPSWLAGVSPLTGVSRVAGMGLSGASGPVPGDQWVTLGVIGSLGLILWGIAAIWSMRTSASVARRRAGGNAYDVRSASD